MRCALSHEPQENIEYVEDILFDYLKSQAPLPGENKKYPIESEEFPRTKLTNQNIWKLYRP